MNRIEIAIAPTPTARPLCLPIQQSIMSEFVSFAAVAASAVAVVAVAQAVVTYLRLGTFGQSNVQGHSPHTLLQNKFSVGGYAAPASSRAATVQRSGRFVGARRPVRQRFTPLSMSSGLSQDELKQIVGYKSVDDYVTSGMVVGLGTGSTAYFAVERLGQKLKSGELTDIVAIPTSVRTKEQAESLGIPLVTLDTHSRLDVAIDGADDVDPGLNLVKGGGGALLREKMVEVMADKFIVIVDESKLSDGLGPGFPVPVEITPFCHEHTRRSLGELSACANAEAVLRLGSSSNNQPDGDEPAVTDNGNYIVDLHFSAPIADPAALAEQINSVVGVVEHGLFCGMSTAVIVAASDGVRVLEA